MTEITTPPFLTHADFECAGLRYGFFTRLGGVSTEPYASLNFSSKDDDANIQENLNRVAAAMQVEPRNLISCQQIHSTTVIATDTGWARNQRPEADAIVTRNTNLALGVLSADCAPILFYDEKAGVIGAAHAGWRGALNGVAEATIAAMEKLGAHAHAIHAVIGACIQQNSYEVGAEFPQAFIKQDTANAIFFKTAPRAGHFLFDLPGYLQQRLRLQNLAAVHSLGFDTCSDEKRFFSYRRATLRKEGVNGTLISVIRLSHKM